MRVLRIGCVLLLIGAACSSSPGSTTTTSSETVAPDAVATTATTLQSPGDFRGAVDGVTTSLLVLQPELVTELGAGEIVGFSGQHLLDDLSYPGRLEIGQTAAEGLATLAALEVGELTAQEQLWLEVLRWYLADEVAMAEFVAHDNPVNFITGAHSGFPEFMADVHPIRTKQDAEDYVSRLRGFAEQTADLAERLDLAADAGIVPTATSLAIASWQIRNTIGEGAGDSHPLVTDLLQRAEALAGEDGSWVADLAEQASAAVADLIVPALIELDKAVQAVDGRSNAQPGMTYVPGGDEYYAAVLRHHLSIEMAPEQVHEIGLEQVDRVVAELTAELKDLGYDVSAGLVPALRKASLDAGALPTTSASEREVVLQRTVNTIDEAAEAFAEIFTVRPETELDVVRPRPGREGGSGAYYRSPPIDDSRSGIYYLSLGGSEFGVLTMSTTTYHEGIPGHHFQLGVQRSLEELPLHQRVFDFTGYAEGWALYAERLAYEAGLYDDDPLGNIGRLQMELLRASRMVVDTGIHWAGWSRSEAIDYMVALGFDQRMAENEVDRYVVWPGQAPAYLVGMLEILRLRDLAMDELGDRFDVVGFHDALLSQGSVPVALLEDVVEMWIEAVG